MKINKIAIACFKKDLYLLRPCIASIRYWYPDIEIFLIKDLIAGDFSTKEFEKYFNVKIFETDMKYFGWPWSKLSVIFDSKKDRYLFLDSDIVLVGKVVDFLNQFNDDFIVTGIEEKDEKASLVTRDYIDIEKIKTFDPQFKYPGFGFNGGQIVMTSGMLSKNDFERVIDFSSTISNKFPHIFKHGDQGILNYVFAKCKDAGKISVRYVNFWVWPNMPQAQELELESIKNKTGYPLVLHWAGAKPVQFNKYHRFDILMFYEKLYYQQAPFGFIKRYKRKLSHNIVSFIKICKYKLFRMDYVK